MSMVRKETKIIIKGGYRNGVLVVAGKLYKRKLTVKDAKFGKQKIDSFIEKINDTEVSIHHA